ncbi:MAG: hypothetical protein H0V45_04635 [Actinobacteria bacterium]|nr:hypothetical protein [Actinomycetota bacterium]
MDEDPALLARLDRIDALDRRGAHPRELLAELRGLLQDAEACRRAQRKDGKEVVERLRTALERDIIGT